jgi:phosphatidylglycerophosphate synthase
MSHPSAPSLTFLVISTALASIPTLLLVAYLAYIVGDFLSLPSAYVFQCSAIFAGLLLCLLPFLPSHLPIDRFGMANCITLLRAGITILLAGLVGRPEALTNHGWFVASLTLIAMTLDGLDGWLARRSGMQSAFGARFDMEVDAFLILILAILVYQCGKAGAWVLLAGVLRYGFVALSYTLPWLRRSLPPRKRRQTICVIQTATLAVCLTPLLNFAWATVLTTFALGLLTLSFAIDIVWLMHHCTDEERFNDQP